MGDRRVDVTPILAIVTGALGSLMITALALPSGTATVSTPAVHPAPEAQIIQPRVMIKGGGRPEVIHFAPLPEVPAIEHVVLPRMWAPPTPDERKLIEGGALILHEGLVELHRGQATFTPHVGLPRRHPDRRKHRRRPRG